MLRPEIFQQRRASHAPQDAHEPLGSGVTVVTLNVVTGLIVDVVLDVTSDVYNVDRVTRCCVEISSLRKTGAPFVSFSPEPGPGDAPRLPKPVRVVVPRSLPSTSSSVISSQRKIKKLFLKK